MNQTFTKTKEKHVKFTKARSSKLTPVDKSRLVQRSAHASTVNRQRPNEQRNMDSRAARRDIVRIIS